VRATDVCIEIVGWMVVRATVSVPFVGQPEGCRTVGLACMHSCLVVEVPGKDRAEEEQGLSWVDEYALSSLAVRGAQAVGKVLAGGKELHWAWVERQRASHDGYAGRPERAADGEASWRALAECVSLVEERRHHHLRRRRRHPSCP
jgi:hypothetical protein